MSHITVLPCLDSSEMAEERRNELWISRNRAAELGESAVLISSQGWYLNSRNERVDLPVQAAVEKKKSIPPNTALPTSEQSNARMSETGRPNAACSAPSAMCSLPGFLVEGAVLRCYSGIFSFEYSRISET